MNQRRLLAVLLPMVALAGCTGGLGGEPGDVSPDEVPGVSNGTLQNASALTAANERILHDNGAVIQVNQSNDGREVLQFRLTMGTDMSTYALSGSGLESGGSDRVIDIWGNETVRYIRSTVDGETSYQTLDWDNSRLTVLGTVENVVAAGAFTVENTSAADGTVVLTADEQADSDSGSPLGDVSSVDGRLVVDESGLIRSLTFETATADDSTSYSYDLRETGIASVARPDWLDDVPAGTTLQPELSIGVENNSYLVVRNEGGDSVPANSSLRLTSNETSADVRFESSLDASDSRYAYISSSSGELTLAEDRPAPSAVESLSSPISVTIATENGAELRSAGMAWSSDTASAPESGSAGTSTGSPNGPNSESTTANATDSSVGTGEA